MGSGDKVIGYVRVSTDKQGERGAGLEAQRKAIRAECDRRGWQLLRIEEDVESGKSMKKRPGLDRALAAVEGEGREAAGIVVAKLDRLTRSLSGLVHLMERSSKKPGWQLVALDMGVDTTTPIGKAMAQMAGVFAELERGMIGERTKAGLAVKKAQGVELGGPAIPEQLRKRMRKLRDGTDRTRGLTYREIAARLNKQGKPTARGGKQWYAATVQHALGEHGHGKPRGPRSAAS
jgi:DNA invertase Pin-like site-specific DNA recombinase